MKLGLFALSLVACTNNLEPSLAGAPDASDTTLEVEGYSSNPACPAPQIRSITIRNKRYVIRIPTMCTDWSDRGDPPDFWVEEIHNIK